MTSEGQILIGRYRLLSRLGQGGMGSVWKATDQLLERTVALKELVPHVSGLDLAESRARAQVEARAMARVKHPAIVRIHDLFLVGGDPWIVMEYISGRSLADIIREKPLDEQAVAAIGLPVLQGLQAAHAANMVHRDVKPANIVVAGDGSIFLVDFGIAKIAGETSLTGYSRVLGTTEFMAPERLRGRRVGAPADLWSFGVTLYCALERRSPFLRRGDGSIEATIAAILNDEPPEPAKWGKLAEIVLQMLRKEPAERPDAPAVIAVLEAVLGAAPSPAASAASAAVAATQVTSPPHQFGDPRADTALSSLRTADAVEIISNSGTETGAAMLLGMRDKQAARILTGCSYRVAGELVQAIAATRPERAGAILQIFPPRWAGSVLEYVSPASAASILGAMTVGEAVRVLRAADARTAAGVLSELTGRRSGELVTAMPETRAVAVLAHVKPADAADVLNAVPRELRGRLLQRLSPAFRELILRYM